MSTAAAMTLTPADRGRRMTLADFDRAEAVPGPVFELGRGVVVMVDVPDRPHLAQINALRRIVHAYDAAHPGQVHTIASGSECKILLADRQSERHPDLALYKTAPPEGDDFWAEWVPEVVVEVVSPGSKERDYVEKRAEYRGTFTVRGCCRGWSSTRRRCSRPWQAGRRCWPGSGVGRCGEANQRQWLWAGSSAGFRRGW